MLSTAWPWPYAPTGLPKLTVQMNRADPFNQFDGCGDGRVDVLVRRAGRQDLQPLGPQPGDRASASYLASNGTKDAPPPPSS